MLDASSAEQAVIGSILIDPNGYFIANQELLPEDFHDPICRSVFIEMGHTIEKGGKIDTSSLSGFEPSALCLFLEVVPTAANLNYYISLVLEASQKRALMRAGRRLMELSEEALDLDAALTEAESLVLSIRRLKTSQTLKSVKDLSLKIYNELEKRESAPLVKGQRSGLMGLDELLGGFGKTELCIIAARPSCGKSALLGHILMRAAQDGKRVLWSSLEMSHEQLVNRLFATISNVPLHVLIQGLPSDDEWQRLATAAGKLSDVEMYIDDSGHMTVPKLASVARRMKAESGLDILGVDYLQLMSAPAKTRDNREGEIADMTRQLKQLAKELDIPIILLSQLNRLCEMREDKRPRLSDLRESGSIEQDANKVVMLYREHLYNQNADEDEIEILVRKNRDGRTGKVKAKFIGERMRFVDDEKRHGAMDQRNHAGARNAVRPLRSGFSETRPR